MKELLEAEAAKARDITEEIEEARAKVEAKTPITQEVRGRGGGGVGGGGLYLYCCRVEQMHASSEMHSEWRAALLW
jgi:hypothetical protein